MSDQLVYVYGTRSKVHLAVRHDGRMLTSERCNLDDLRDDDRVVVDSLDDVPDTKDLCSRCFPVAEAQHEAETVTLA